MKVHIENVFKNMRYKIFSIDGDHYILEIKPSFWKILFPFLYWFFPFPVYKAEDEETIKRIKTPESWSMNKSSVAISVGGFGVLIAILLRGKIDDLIIQMPLSVKIISVIFTVLCILFIRLYVNRVKQHDLYKKVNLNQLDKTYVKVKPQSLKHIFQMIIIYLFFLSFAALFYVTYLSLENIFLLLMGSIMLFVSLIVVNITVKEGWTTIKMLTNERIS